MRSRKSRHEKIKTPPSFKEIKKWLPLALMSLIILLSWLPYFKTTYLQDNTRMIANPEIYRNGLLLQGRYGIVLLNQLFFGTYTQTTNALIPFITVPLLILISGYLYFLIGKYIKIKNNWIKMCCGLLFALNPAVYGMYFYKMQLVPVVLALFAVMIAGQLWISDAFSFRLRTFLAVILLSFAFLTYQTFALVALSLALFWLVFRPEQRRSITKSALLSGLIAGIIYELINRIWPTFYGAPLLAKRQNYTANTSSELKQYFHWSSLFLNGLHFATIVFIVLLLFVLLYLVHSLFVQKNWDHFLFAGLTFSLFLFPLIFGNIELPTRIYFGSFGLVLAGIILRNYQKKVPLSLGMFFVTMTALLLLYHGRISYSDLPFILMMVVLSVCFIFSMSNQWQTMLPVILCFGIMNVVSISTLNATFTKDIQWTQILLHAFEQKKLDKKAAGHYHVYFAGTLEKDHNSTLLKLTKAWTGWTAVTNLTDHTEYTQVYQRDLFKLNGWKIAHVYFIDSNGKQQKRSYLKKLSVITTGKDFLTVIKDKNNVNIYVKLGNESNF